MQNVLFVSGMAGDTQRYRCLHHQEQLALQGIASTLRTADDWRLYVDATVYDLFILHRVAYTPLIQNLIELAHQRGKTVIFETDDLVFEPELYRSIGYIDSLPPEAAEKFRQDLIGQATTVTHCDYVLTTTQFLADAAQSQGKSAYVQRNAFSAEMLRCSEAAYGARQQRLTKDDQAEVRIGYFSGTGSHNRDFALITPALIEIIQRYPTVKLHIGGHLTLPPAFEPYQARIVRLPFVPWQELPNLLAQLDINLAPLETHNRFCQAKSEIKYTEAALVGVPTIASPTDAFRYAIESGITGCLAATHDEWVTALSQWIENPTLRRSIGEAARNQVLRDYAPQVRSEQLVATLGTMLQQSAVAQPINLPVVQRTLPIRTVFIAAGCPVGTVTRYRSEHLQEQLALNQIQATVYPWQDHDPALLTAAAKADLIVLQRVVMSESVRLLVDNAHQQGKQVIFDADDLIFEPDLADCNRTIAQFSPDELRLYHEGVARYLATLQASDYVFVASRVLAELAQQRNKIAFVHRNAIGCEMQTLGDRFFAQRAARPPQERIVIGYGSGTATHNVDFEQIASAMAEVLRRHPTVELWLAGPLALPADLTPWEARIRRFPLSDLAGWFELASQFDINLAPLEIDNIFCRAKSEIKVVEAGLLGVPTVASRIDPFVDAITSGQDGLLAGEPVEWIAALEQLICQPALRASLGQAARATVAARYSLPVRATELATILQTIDKDGPAPRPLFNAPPTAKASTAAQELLRLLRQTQKAVQAGGVLALYQEFKQYIRWQLSKPR